MRHIIRTLHTPSPVSTVREFAAHSTRCHRPSAVSAHDSSPRLAQTSLRFYTTTSATSSAVKTTPIVHAEDRSISEAAASLVACPYTPGNRLTLDFQAEDGSNPTTVEAVVVQVHSPFTLAQSMLVQRAESHPALQSYFVLKLADPRFAAPVSFGLNRKPGWTTQCEDAFNRGLIKVRRGEWTNYWECLGATSTRVPSGPDIDPSVDEARCDWMEEMERWSDLREVLKTEPTAYRALRVLQGFEIPILYGSCTVLLHRTTPGLDPLVGNVPGLVLQHIEGTSLDRLTLGKDLSVSDAERVSQGALAVLRKIRDALVEHGDFAPRNIIVRPHDLDHPALIDFGSARTLASTTYTEEQWIEVMANDREVPRARLSLGSLGLHNPSPVPEIYHQRASRGFCGYASLNIEVEGMRPEWRDQYFEPIHAVPPDKITITSEGKERRWVYPRWRVKPGVNTATAYADVTWGRKDNLVM